MLNYEVCLAFVDNKSIQYNLIKNSCSTLKIFIKDNTIFVSVPYSLSQDCIDAFVKKNIGKFFSYLTNIKEKSAIDLEVSRIKILNKYYDIKLTPMQSSKRYDIVGNVVYINNKYKKEEIIKSIYTDIICPLVNKRLKFWQIKMGLTKYHIDIAFTWSRVVLGACHKPINNKVKIKFSNRIFACEKEEIDYVIVHELSHIKHFHHRKEFWDYVKLFIPNYSMIIKKLHYF